MMEAKNMSDETIDLDNELSIISVVTPDKQKMQRILHTTPDEQKMDRNLNTTPDDIIELDNELSIISIVTPDKQKTQRNLNFYSPVDSPHFTSLKRNLGETSFNQELKVSDLEDDLIVNPFDVNKRKQKRRAKLSDQEKKDKEAEKLKDKERKKLEKEESNRRKEKLKQKERKLKEANKFLNLKNSSQYCTTIISKVLTDKFLTNNALIMKAFEEADIKLLIDDTIDLPLIKWTRTLHTRNDPAIAEKSVLNLSEILNKEEVEEDHLIIILNKEQFVKMVYKYVLESGEPLEEAFEFDENDPDNISLLNYIIRLVREHRKSVVLIIYNLEAYFRGLKNRAHRDFLNLMSDNQPKQRKANKSSSPLITRMNVEESILNANLELMKNDEIVELNLKVNFQFVDNQSDLVNLICNLSNSMANAPFRRWRNAQEGFEWFVDGDCKTGSVNIKDLPADVNKLWLKHLLLFNKVSLPIAKSICHVYPNLMQLKDKYDSLESLEDKKSLLSKIVIQNTNRTINIDISKRIYKFLTETDEDEILA